MWNRRAATGSVMGSLIFLQFIASVSLADRIIVVRTEPQTQAVYWYQKNIKRIGLYVLPPDSLDKDLNPTVDLRSLIPQFDVSDGKLDRVWKEDQKKLPNLLGGDDIVAALYRVSSRLTDTKTHKVQIEVHNGIEVSVRINGNEPELTVAEINDFEYLFKRTYQWQLPKREYCRFQLEGTIETLGRIDTCEYHSAAEAFKVGEPAFITASRPIKGEKPATVFCTKNPVPVIAGMPKWETLPETKAEALEQACRRCRDQFVFVLEDRREWTFRELYSTFKFSSLRCAKPECVQVTPEFDNTIYRRSVVAEEIPRECGTMP